MSLRSSNLSVREEKFESSADSVARGVGEAEVTTATIAVAAAIADADHESLAIILEKQTFAALSFILGMIRMIGKPKKIPIRLRSIHKRISSLNSVNHLKCHQNAY